MDVGILSFLCLVKGSEPVVKGSKPVLSVLWFSFFFSYFFSFLFPSLYDI
jgi:hypothetical protein